MAETDGNAPTSSDPKTSTVGASGLAPEGLQRLMAEWRTARATETFDQWRGRMACADDLESWLASQPPTSQETETLRRAVGNCYMMAKREIARHLNQPLNDPKGLERWQHVQRFCETTGEKSSILRGQLPTEITEGSAPSQPRHGDA